jgi:multiple antibiotic resistance protein
VFLFVKQKGGAVFERLVQSAAGTFVSLVPVTDPLGVVPLFYSLTSGSDEGHRRRQAGLATIHVIWVLALFLLAGKLVLSFFGISLAVLRIAGGVLIAHTGWQMVRSSGEEEEVGGEGRGPVDIAFAPMAVPLVSGPGAIGVVIGLAAKSGGWMDTLGALAGIGLIGGLVYLCLRLGEPLLKLLGRTGTSVFNQLFGFLTVALAVQFVVDGALALVRR